MKKCALVVGHKPDQPGACNKTYNICEFEFNNNLIDRVMNSLVDPVDPDGGMDLVKVLRNTYKTLPDDINKLNPDFIISFHANAYNGKFSGTETLYYKGSVKGRKMAEIFQRNMVTVLKLKDRGIEGRDTEDRGGHLLKYTNAPCIIIEPFFIDNDSDFERVSEVKEFLIMAIQRSLFEIADII